jgi:hypothetical protein
MAVGIDRKNPVSPVPFAFTSWDGSRVACPRWDGIRRGEVGSRLLAWIAAVLDPQEPSPAPATRPDHLSRTSRRPS